MKLLKPGLLVFMAALVMIGCSSPPPVNDMPDRKDATNPKTPMDLPDWYINNVEEDETYYFSVGMGESKKMDLAIDKAKQAGRVELSERVAAKVQSQVKSFTQEAGMTENTQIVEFYQSTSKTVTDNTLNGVSVLKRYPYQKSDGTWIAYVQLALKKDAVSTEVVDLIKNEEALYAEFKASQGFKDLEAAVGKTE
ncbi:MAG: LPP20 family lipoprotein [Candidatus Marinimicrobia bacterium]|nr:LPP20 family lipoprotein [Candidatus Neomarinimicrobiota bacterium]MCF7904710.1 LPP20 family lipoprotein [Candidatus Neomarinimicrobiota bacterium]